MHPYLINPYTADGLFGRYNMMQDNLLTEPLAHRYLSDSTQQELSNEYQH